MNLLGGEDKDEEKKEDEEAEEVADSAGNNVASMKDGEYILHVLVESGKSMFMEGEDTIDPLIKVSFVGNSK